jgi:hypothetical protein
MLLETNIFVGKLTWMDVSCLMIQRQMGLNVWTGSLKGKHVLPNQPLDFIFQSPTFFGVMAGCPLMKITEMIRPIPPWKFLRHWIRWPSLGKIILNQSGKQLRIRHRDRFKMRCPWTVILFIWMWWSPLSRQVSWIVCNNMTLLVVTSLWPPLG